MSLDRLKYHKSLDKNPIAKERILEIQKTAKHPLIIITGAHGVGKDTTIQELIKKIEGIPKMRRATSREPKERDAEGDFKYYTPQEIEKAIQSGKVLFAYDSDRNDGTKYGLLYDELKKLEKQSYITVIGTEGLDVKYYVPHITCCLVRNEEELIQALKNRTSDKQTQKNIRSTKRNLSKYLNNPGKAEIIIENKNNNIDETVSEIKSAIEYFENESSTQDTKLLTTIFDANILSHVTDGKGLTSFRESLIRFLIDEKNDVREDKLEILINFMFLKKFNRFHFHDYLELIGDGSNKRSKKNIYEEIALFYRETAKILYEMGLHKEAKKVMLQIGEQEYAFTEKDKNKKIEKKDITIKECLNSLDQIYDYSYKEKHKMIFVQNTSTSTKFSTRITKDTLLILLATKGIEIEQTCSTWGEFRIKLLEPSNEIEYIECQIIRNDSI